MAKCSTKRCTNERAKSRLFCHKCRKKKYKENNPVNNAYFILKYNAKRRGKEFSLTLEEFKQFCIETDYMSKKGRRSKSYTIDRKNDEEGYTKANIRILTNAENVSKENKRRVRKELREELGTPF